MKKVLIFAAALAMSNGAFAQAGSLSITNNNQNCGVYVNMVGYAPTEGDGLCDLLANSIYVPPLTTVPTYSTPAAFASSVGYYYEATAISAGTWSTIKDFVYTDVKFQWQCPIPPCQTDGGGAMSETSSPGGNCQAANESWSYISCTSGTSTWTSPGGYMANVAIVFN